MASTAETDSKNSRQSSDETSRRLVMMLRTVTLLAARRVCSAPHDLFDAGGLVGELILQFAQDRRGFRQLVLQPLYELHDVRIPLRHRGRIRQRVPRAGRDRPRA